MKIVKFIDLRLVNAKVGCVTYWIESGLDSQAIDNECRVLMPSPWPGWESRFGASLSKSGHTWSRIQPLIAPKENSPLAN